MTPPALKTDTAHDTAGPLPEKRRIGRGFIHPSAALTVPVAQLKWYCPAGGAPEAGDLVYGRVVRIGEHSSLENRSGRIHVIHNGSRAVFVYGNRYAPDYYEGVVPDTAEGTVDMLARSGLIGRVLAKSAMRKDPTRIEVLGRVCDKAGTPLSTRQFSRVNPRHMTKKKDRARMILVVGTSMNSGKSMAATACCWALTSRGFHVRAAKVTGTASLKDILHMNDAGAHPYADFTSLGHPSTYLCSREELLDIFNRLDLKYANNPKNFWVVELADGVIQRETAMLLDEPEVRGRIHRLIFCANDAFGAIGGLRVLKERFGMVPDAISGLCSTSPLHIRELSGFTSIPVFNSADINAGRLQEILLG